MLNQRDISETKWTYDLQEFLPKHDSPSDIYMIPDWQDRIISYIRKYSDNFISGDNPEKPLTNVERLQQQRAQKITERI